MTVFLENSGTSALDLNHILAVLGIASDDTTAAAPYTIIPGNDGPRWLIPNGNPSAHLILREWRPYSAGARLFWSGICLAARTGMLPLVPRTTQASLPRDISRQILSSVGSDSADAEAPIILVGNASPTRKILIFLVDGTHNLVVKLPLTPAARDSIHNEAEILSKLDGKHGAPRAIHFSSESGVATQEYLAGKLGSRRCKPSYLRLLVDLARTGETLSLAARARLVRHRLGMLDGYREHRRLVDSALALFDGDINVPSFLVHGDFAPWNIREMRDGSCTLIDWESAEWRGLPLHDLCHFFYMQTKLFAPHKLFYAELLREGSWRTYCQKLDLPLSILPRLAAAFLLATLATGWENGPAQSTVFCLRQLDLLLKY